MRQNNTRSDDVSIGRRIKAERQRLGLSQDEFASRGGVAKATQVAYEAGRRVPDLRYLQALLAGGVDVVFLATGQSTGAASENLNPSAMRAVATALVDWLTVTDRELTPELMERVIKLLYEIAVVRLNSETHGDVSAAEAHLERLLSEQMSLVG